MIDAYDSHSDDFDEDRGPSKSSIKREMQALQDLGAELVDLSAERLKKVPLPDSLREAIKEAQRITKHGARRRQLQYIGKLMRNVEVEPIVAQLDAFKGVSKAEVARQHRLERLRDDFMADEKRIGEIVEQWPDADVQHLRVLRRNALKERDNNKPPRSYRELFRVLRDLDASASQSDAAEEAAEEAAEWGEADHDE